MAGEFDLVNSDEGASDEVSLASPFPFYGATESTVFVSSASAIQLLACRYRSQTVIRTCTRVLVQSLCFLFVLKRG